MAFIPPPMMLPPEETELDLSGRNLSPKARNIKRFLHRQPSISKRIACQEKNAAWLEQWQKDQRDLQAEMDRQRQEILGRPVQPRRRSWLSRLTFGVFQ